MTAPPIAFYAPLKSPNHPTPSGDRSMARLLLRALRRAGFAPLLASELRSFDRNGDPGEQARCRSIAGGEARRLIAAYRDLPVHRRPAAWLSYHVYYKAPDWIGPTVSEALAIPYLVAEGSRAAKRAGGAWAIGHAGAEAALDRAQAVFVMAEADREGLERHRPAGQRLIDLPPFLDLEDWPRFLPSEPRHDGPPRLLTVAMMRRGDKLASYRILAEALRQLGDRRFVLDVVGDGEAWPEVEAAFAGLAAVRWHGRIDDRERLAAFYAAADLLLWPAVNEAYGMALLEAQAFATPVVAGRCGGVASVVRDGATGLLTAPHDAAAFAAAVARLLDDPALRQRLGQEAYRFAREERGLEPAARRLRAAMAPLIGARTAA